MRVRVRLFAIQREVAGTREIAVDVAPDATVEDAWAALVALVPALAPGRGSVRFAVNGRYAEPTTILADGDEVACIPPLSGGSGDADPGDADPGEADPGAGGRIRILEIRDVPFPDALLAELSGRIATHEDGGVVSFVGRTRASAGTPAPGQEAEAARHAGRRVEALEYEAFEPMALDILGGIADEIEAHWGVRRLAIVHRIGPVPLGEASVIVVAAAPHRDAAFAAARYAIDETKARAPIWKAERFTDGHVWVGDLARDGPIG
jgi:molybdopterin synthase catalytic subunit/molybdopterin converting factor small subunit